MSSEWVPEPGTTRIYEWQQTAEVVQSLCDIYPFRIEERGRHAETVPGQGHPDLKIYPPPLLPIPEIATDIAAWLAQTPASPGRFLVLLMQAGAGSYGLWQDDQVITHKTLRKYVTRGNGKAQTTYLKTRGKSRYGSRLRLRNANLFLTETNEKFNDWWGEHGPWDRVFFSCPVRMWPELFKARPAPPFEKQNAIKIGMDVRVPSFEELQRVRTFLGRGRIVRANEAVERHEPGPITDGAAL